MIHEGWADDTQRTVNWLKIPEGTGVILQFIHDNFIHYRAHYITKRMRLCKGAECEYCKLGIAGQQRYVFDIVDITLKAQFAFECSKGFAEKIRDYSNYNSGLRNRLFDVSRLSTSRFSNMSIIEVFEHNPIDESRFEPIDIKNLLESQELLFSLQKKSDQFKPDCLKGFKSETRDAF